MRLRKSNWLRAGVLACLCLAGCEVGPDYHAPDMKMPERFAASSDAAADSKPVIDARKWWQAFNDPELNSLIDRAIQSNPDIEIALDRMQEARVQEDVVMGGALPEADASFGGGRGTGSDLARGRAGAPLVSAEDTGHLQQVTHIYGFDAGWELDLFGKYRREMEAAAYDEQAALAARNAVLITVIADVVRGYIDMRALQMQLAVLRQNTRVAQEYLKVTKERYDRGITNELDLTLAQRQLEALEAKKMPLVAQVKASQYVIAVLLGKFPEDIARELEKPGVIPALPEKVDTGLPLDLLRRRPDIQQAERELAGATARIGVATADLFPHVSLTGAAGYQGQGLGVTPDVASFIWSAGPSVSWSLLDFGTLDGLVDIADLRTREMLVNYKRTVLNAVREVDTSIGAYAGQQDQLRHLGKALTAAESAATLATKRYNRGLTDALNVVDAERQEYAIEEQYVSAQQSAAGQFVTLYKALGGGWEQYQSFPPAPTPMPAVVAAFTRLLNSDDPVADAAARE